jgi:uncharacterized protein (TIGR02145 family)
MVTDKSDLITVTINKTGLSANKIIDSLKIISVTGQNVLEDYLRICLNGVMDQDLNYYNTVKTGTQIWMAENLKTGSPVNLGKAQQNNGIIEYFMAPGGSNVQRYGGLYQWNEMMQYKPSDAGSTGTTQGVCPDGWHLPAYNEWNILINYLGGANNAGTKLKAISSYWIQGTANPTNESGFSGLPGGINIMSGNLYHEEIGRAGYWWIATEVTGTEAYTLELTYDKTSSEIVNKPKFYGCSVRCVKNR